MGGARWPNERKGDCLPETGGCCDQVCERFFFKVAKFFNSRMTYSNSVKLLSPKILLAEKMSLKVEIPVF